MNKTFEERLIAYGKIAVLKEARLDVLKSKQMAICDAIRKHLKHRITCAEIQEYFGLTPYKPSHCRESYAWWDFDEVGQKERLRVLEELIYGLNIFVSVQKHGD